MKKSISGILLASVMSLGFLAAPSTVKESGNAEEGTAIALRAKAKEERNCVISTLVENITSGKTYTFKIDGKDVGRFRLTKYKKGWAISKGTMFVGIQNKRIVYKLTPTEWNYEDGAFSLPVKKVNFGFIHIDTSEQPTQYIKSFKVGARLTTDKTNVEIYDVIRSAHAMTDWIDCEDGVHHKKVCLNECGYEEIGVHNFGEFNSSLYCLDCGAINPGDPEVNISAAFREVETVNYLNILVGKPFKYTTYYADVDVSYNNVGISKVELRMNEQGNFVEGYSCSLDSRIKTLEVRVTDTRNNVYNEVFKNLIVSFDLQGKASKIAPITHVGAGDKIAAPEKPAPTKDEIFAGWYKEAECENPWDFEVDTVEDDTVLYAKYVKGHTLSSVLSLSYDIFPYATSATPVPTKSWVSGKGIRAYISGENLVLLNGTKKLTLPLATEMSINENNEYIIQEGSVTWKFNLLRYFGFDYLGYFEVEGSEGFDGAYGKASSKLTTVIANAIGMGGFPVGEARPVNAWSNEKGNRLYVDSATGAITIESPNKEAIVLQNNVPVNVFDNYVIRDEENNIKLMLNTENGKLTSIEIVTLESSEETSDFGTFIPAYDLGSLLGTTFPVTDINKAPLDAWLNGNGGKAYIDANGNFAIADNNGIVYSDSLERPYVYKDGYYVNVGATEEDYVKVGYVDDVVTSIIVNGSFGSGANGTYTALGITVSSVLDTLKVIFPYFNGNGEVWSSASGATVYYDEDAKAIVFSTFSLTDTTACTRDGENYVCTYKKGYDSAKVTFVMDNGTLTSIVVSDASLMIRRANGEYVPTSFIETVKDVLDCSNRAFPVRSAENNNNSSAIPEEAWENENGIKCFIQNGEDTQSLVFCEVLDVKGYKIEKKITIDNILDNIDQTEGDYVYQYFTFKMTRGVLSSIEVNYPQGSLYISFNGSYQPVL